MEILHEIKVQGLTNNIYFSSLDKQPPILQCVNTTIQGILFWRWYAIVPPISWPYLALSDDSGEVAKLKCDRRRHSRFPLGISASTCTAQDDAGNTASCNITVEVQGK